MIVDLDIHKCYIREDIIAPVSVAVTQDEKIITIQRLKCIKRDSTYLEAMRGAEFDDVVSLTEDEAMDLANWLIEKLCPMVV